MIKKFPTKKIVDLVKFPIFLMVFPGLPGSTYDVVTLGPPCWVAVFFGKNDWTSKMRSCRHGGHHPTNRHCCRHPFRLIFRSGPERFGCCLCLRVSVRNGDGSEITRIGIVEVGSLSHDLRGFSSIPGGYFGIFWIVSSMNKGTEKNQLSNKKKHSCLGYTVYSGMKYTS